MYIKDVPKTVIADYCGVVIDEEKEQAALLEIFAEAAKAFIKSETGLDDEGINKHEDLSVAFLVLTNEMYDKRDFTVDKTNLNPLVKQILALHSVNYL